MLLILVRLAGVWTRGLGCRCYTAAPMWRYRLFVFFVSSGFPSYVEGKGRFVGLWWKSWSEADRAAAPRGPCTARRESCRVVWGGWLECPGSPREGW